MCTYKCVQENQAFSAILGLSYCFYFGRPVHFEVVYNYTYVNVHIPIMRSGIRNVHVSSFNFYFFQTYGAGVGGQEGVHHMASNQLTLIINSYLMMFIVNPPLLLSVQICDFIVLFDQLTSFMEKHTHVFSHDSIIYIVSYVGY